MGSAGSGVRARCGHDRRPKTPSPTSQQRCRISERAEIDLERNHAGQAQRNLEEGLLRAARWRGLRQHERLLDPPLRGCVPRRSRRSSTARGVALDGGCARPVDRAILMRVGCSGTSTSELVSSAFCSQSLGVAIAAAQVQAARARRGLGMDRHPVGRPATWWVGHAPLRRVDLRGRWVACYP